MHPQHCCKLLNTQTDTWRVEIWGFFSQYQHLFGLSASLLCRRMFQRTLEGKAAKLERPEPQTSGPPEKETLETVPGSPSWSRTSRCLFPEGKQKLAMRRSLTGGSLPLECLLPHADFPVPELGVIPIYTPCVYTSSAQGMATLIMLFLCRH